MDVSLNSSYLWEYFNVFEFRQNMQLSTAAKGDLQDHELAAFDNWLLKISDRSYYDNVEKELIKIPNDMLLQYDEDPVKCTLQTVYPLLQQSYNGLDYLKQRAILTLKMKQYTS